MSKHPKDNRTPEQIAKSIAIVKERQEREKKEEFQKNINRGRLMLIIVGALFALGAAIEYASSEMIEIFYILGPIVLFYVLLAIFFHKNPFTVSVVGLSFYVLVIILDGVFDPSTLWKGIILKVFIIYSLLTTIKTAKQHKDLLLKNKKVDNEDLLDSELV